MVCGEVRALRQASSALQRALAPHELTLRADCAACFCISWRDVAPSFGRDPAVEAYVPKNVAQAAAWLLSALPRRTPGLTPARPTDKMPPHEVLAMSEEDEALLRRLADPRRLAHADALAWRAWTSDVPWSPTLTWRHALFCAALHDGWPVEVLLSPCGGSFSSHAKFGHPSLSNFAVRELVGNAAALLRWTRDPARVDDDAAAKAYAKTLWMFSEDEHRNMPAHASVLSDFLGPLVTAGMLEAGPVAAELPARSSQSNSAASETADAIESDKDSDEDMCASLTTRAASLSQAEFFHSVQARLRSGVQPPAAAASAMARWRRGVAWARLSRSYRISAVALRNRLKHGCGGWGGGTFAWRVDDETPLPQAFYIWAQQELLAELRASAKAVALFVRQPLHPAVSKWHTLYHSWQGIDRDGSNGAAATAAFAMDVLKQTWPLLAHASKAHNVRSVVALMRALQRTPFFARLVARRNVLCTCTKDDGTGGGGPLVSCFCATERPRNVPVSPKCAARLRAVAAFLVEQKPFDTRLRVVQAYYQHSVQWLAACVRASGATAKDLAQTLDLLSSQQIQFFFAYMRADADSSA